MLDYREQDRRKDMEYTTLLLNMDGTFLDFRAAERSAFFRPWKITAMRPTKAPISFYSRINHGLWEAFERGEIDKQTLLFTRFGRLFESMGVEGDGAAFEKEYQLLFGRRA